ncbi:MAG TPA: hypothetical protein PK720_02135 [bacterium]|nr:hypothetical protein [bacterium]
MKLRLIFLGLVAILFFSYIPVRAAVELGGLEKTAKTAKIDRKESDPAIFAGEVVQWVLSFIGVIFLGLMIYGGFMWMTSGGNQESISKAQKTIVAAIIGLVIILSAYAITIYIGGTFGAI